MSTILNFRAKKFKNIRQFFVWLSVLSLIFQTASGLFLYNPVFAQEQATASATITTKPTESPTPSPTTTPSPTISPTPTTKISTTPSPTSAIEPSTIPSITPQANSKTEVLTDNDSQTQASKESASLVPELWIQNDDGSITTTEPVTKGVEYKYKDSQTKVIFTKLATSGILTIREFEPENAKQLGIVGKAYEITSDMQDGTFEYDLTLPVPAETKDNLSVKYAENPDGLTGAKSVDEPTEIANNTITIKGLDHFTVFIITDDDVATTYSGGTWIDYATQGYQNNGVHYPSTVPAGQTATWTFSSITPDTYRVYVSWSTHSNRTTSAPYVLNYDGGSTGVMTVNQEQLADQTTTGGSGQWSGWYYLDTQPLDTSSNLVLTSVDNTSGTDYVIADEVLLVQDVAPSEVFIDDGYNINSENDGHVWGYDAFATIQEGIDAVQGSTVNVAAGTYNENIDINKSLTLQSVSGAGSTTIAGTVTGNIIAINADNVAVDGFTITNNNILGTGIYSSDHNDLTITNNVITGIGNSGDDIVGRGVIVVSSSASVDNITITDNEISNITSGLRTGSSSTSASGISIGWSTGSYDITDLLIQNNIISNINADTSPWGGTKGQGAYGILINHGTHGGQTPGAQVLNNTITNLEGLWAHGIGLEGDTPNAVVTGNTISDLTDHKTPSDAVGVQLEDNPSAATVQINNNTFSSLNIGVANKTAEEIVDATGNNWNTTNLAEIEGMVWHDVDDAAKGHVNFNSHLGSSETYDSIKTLNIDTSSTTDLTNGSLTIKSSQTNSGNGVISIAKYTGTPSTGANTISTPFGSYYEIQTSGDIKFPIDIELKYTQTDLDNASLTESQLQGLFYYSTSGSEWRLYSNSGVDDPSGCSSTTTVDAGYSDGSYVGKIDTSACHLTPIGGGGDNTAPNITLDLPNNGGLYSGDIPLQATGNEELNYINFWWRADGQSYLNTAPNRRYHYIYTNGTVFNWTLNSLDAQLWGGDGTYLMNDGDYYFYAAGKDVAGNWAKTSEVQMTVDNTPPSVPVLTWPINNEFTSDNTPLMQWDDSTDSSGVAGYYYKVSYNCSDPSDIPGSCSSVYPNSEGLWRPTSEYQAGTTGDGVYYWQVRSKDNAGNLSAWSNMEKVTIDTIAPDVEITSPSSTLLTGTISIRGSVTDNNPHHYWLVIQNSSGTTVAGPGVVYDTNSFTNQYFFDWDTTSVPDGIYTIRLEARDAADNKDGGSKQWMQVTVDNTAPIVTIDNPVITNDNTPELTGTVDDNTASITIEVNGNSFGATNNGDGTWTLADDTISPALADNTYDVTASATDTAGNIGTDTSTNELTIDTVAPTAIFKQYDNTTEVTGSIAYVTDLARLYFTGEYTDQAPSSNLYQDSYVIFDAQADGSFGFAANGAKSYCSWRQAPNLVDISGASTYSLTAKEPFTNCVNTIEDGEYYMTHQVYDNAVRKDIPSINQFRDVLGLHFVVDTVKPSSVITLPTNDGTNSVVYNSTWYGVIQGTASDATSEVSRVELSIKRNSDNKYWDGTAWVTGSETTTRFDVTGTTSWNYTLPTPAEDTYTITSHAVDTAGNIENSYKLTVVLDKTIPEVSISLSPTTPDGGNNWYITNPTITLTATDTNGTKEIDYQWDSQTGNWTTYSTTFQTPGEGTHVLYYKAKDKASNWSDTGIKTIRYDKTNLTKGPQNIGISPNPTNGTTATVTWNAATDNTGIDHYEVQWKLGSKTYTDSVGADVRSHQINNLTEGDWTVIVRAFDGEGHNKEASVTETVDNTAPSAPVLTLNSTGAGTADLSWGQVTDATSYTLWYGTSSNNYIYGANLGNVTNYTVQGLSAGTYYFVVQARDSAGNGSSNSNEVSTGAIAGSPTAQSGAPAQGFIPAAQVLGENTSTTPTPTPSITPTTKANDNGSVLGNQTTNQTKGNILTRWWLWLLIIGLPLFATYIIYRRNHV